MGRNAIAGFRKAGKEGLREERFITTKCYTLELVSLRRGISPEAIPSNQAGFLFPKGSPPWTLRKAVEADVAPFHRKQPPWHYLGDHTGVISILSVWRSCIGATKGLCHVLFGPKSPPAEDAGRELSWSVYFSFQDGIPTCLGQARLAKLSSSRAFPCPQLLGQMST